MISEMFQKEGFSYSNFIFKLSTTQLSFCIFCYHSYHTLRIQASVMEFVWEIMVMHWVPYYGEKLLVQTDAKHHNILERGALWVYYDCISSRLGRFVLAFRYGAYLRKKYQNKGKWNWNCLHKYCNVNRWIA